MVEEFEYIKTIGFFKVKFIYMRGQIIKFKWSSNYNPVSVIIVSYNTRDLTRKAIVFARSANSQHKSLLIIIRR